MQGIGVYLSNGHRYWYQYQMKMKFLLKLSSVCSSYMRQYRLIDPSYIPSHPSGCSCYHHILPVPCDFCFYSHPHHLNLSAGPHKVSVLRAESISRCQKAEHCDTPKQSALGLEPNPLFRYSRISTFNSLSALPTNLLPLTQRTRSHD